MISFKNAALPMAVTAGIATAAFALVPSAASAARAFLILFTMEPFDGVMDGNQRAASSSTLLIRV